MKTISLALAADVFAHHGHEPALWILTELVVVGGFLADDEAPAAIARIKPFRGWGGGATGAVKTHARTHFNERPALRQMCRFFEFNPHQREPLIVLENANGTNRHFIAGFGLPNGAPIPGRKYYQAQQEHGRQYDSAKNDKGFFQCWLFRWDSM